MNKHTGWTLMNDSVSSLRWQGNDNSPPTSRHLTVWKSTFKTSQSSTALSTSFQIATQMRQQTKCMLHFWWPCWLPDRGQLNYKVVTHPAISLAQDRESSPAETRVLTAMIRRQHHCYNNDLSLQLLVVNSSPMWMSLLHSSKYRNSSYTKYSWTYIDRFSCQII